MPVRLGSFVTIRCVRTIVFIGRFGQDDEFGKSRIGELRPFGGKWLAGAGFEVALFMRLLVGSSNPCKMNGRYRKDRLMGRSRGAATAGGPIGR